MTIERKVVNGSSRALHGLLAVDEAAFKASPDDRVLQLRKEGLLAAIYTHLVCLRAITLLRQ